MDIEEKIDQYLKLKRGFKPPIIPHECALIIIDMQNYQVKGTSPIVEFFEKSVPGVIQYFIKQVDDVVNPNITRLLEFFRANKIPIYYTKFACRRNDRKDYIRNYKATISFQVGDEEPHITEGSDAPELTDYLKQNIPKALELGFKIAAKVKSKTK